MFIHNSSGLLLIFLVGILLVRVWCYNSKGSNLTYRGFTANPVRLWHLTTSARLKHRTHTDLVADSTNLDSLVVVTLVFALCSAGIDPAEHRAEWEVQTFLQSRQSWYETVVNPSLYVLVHAQENNKGPSQHQQNSSLPQKTLPLKCLVCSPAFNSVTLWHHTMSVIYIIYASWLVWDIRIELAQLLCCC